MKRLIIYFFSILLTACLYACSGTSKSKPDAEDKKKIADWYILAKDITREDSEYYADKILVEISRYDSREDLSVPLAAAHLIKAYFCVTRKRQEEEAKIHLDAAEKLLPSIEEPNLHAHLLVDHCYISNRQKTDDENGKARRIERMMSFFSEFLRSDKFSRLEKSDRSEMLEYYGNAVFIKLEFLMKRRKPDDRETERFLQKSFAEIENLSAGSPLPESLCDCYDRAAFFYRGKQDRKKSFHYAEKSLLLAEEKKAIPRASSRRILVEAASHAKEYEKALDYCRRSFRYSLEHPPVSAGTLGNYYFMMGRIYYWMKDYDHAAEYLRKMEQLDLPPEFVPALKNLQRAMSSIRPPVSN